MPYNWIQALMGKPQSSDSIKAKMTIPTTDGDSLKIAQYGITAMVITLYAAFTTLKEKKAHYLSNRYMLLVVSSLFHGHPTIKDMTSIVEKYDPASTRNVAAFFGRAIDTLVSEGKLPGMSESPKASFVELFISLLFAPLVSAVYNFMLFKESLKRHHLIVQTEYRKNFVSRMIFLMTYQLLVAFAVLEFWLPIEQEEGMKLLQVALGGAIVMCDCDDPACVAATIVEGILGKSLAGHDGSGRT